VCEQDPASASEGTLLNWSVLNYDGGEMEYPGTSQNIPIDQPYLALPLVLTPTFNGPEIASGQLPGATAGQDYQTQLGATGGTPPYKWLSLKNTFTESNFGAPFPTTFANKILPEPGNPDKKTITLPFDFPYHGKTWRDISITSQGGIVLAQNDLYIPYGIELRELLGLNTAIYPFYSTEFQYTDYLDGVYLISHSSDATIYWNASVVANGKTSDVNFAARLYPDGVIEFYYGDFINNTSTPWLIGLTGGSKSQSQFPKLNATGISAGINIRFQPAVLPGNLEITTNGLLSCVPSESSKTWTIPVCLEDARGLQAYRELTLTTAALDTNDNLNTPKIRIYPNPVTERAHIQVESSRSGNLDVKIFDLTGKVLLSKSYDIKAGRYVLPLDITRDIAPGIYIIQLSGVVSYREKFYFSIPAG
jgi:hypothetical protein